MKAHKKIIAGLIIAILLAFIFWYGGDAPGLRGWEAVPRGNENAEDVLADLSMVTEALHPEASLLPEKTETVQKTDEIPFKETQSTEDTPMTPAEKEALAECMTSENHASGVADDSKAYSKTNGMVIEETTGKDKYMTDSVPEGKPLPMEPENVIVSDTVLTCTLSVSCDTVLENIAWLDKEKVDFIPQNGIIYEEKTVSFYEGESVFNLLLREMKRSKIHMEFTNVPMYNSAYIEGISNLYEFDCGELSGWMYKVNGWFPNYGCSRYQLCDGDKVEWVYTCNLGVDVGGYYAAKGET